MVFRGGDKMLDSVDMGDQHLSWENTLCNISELIKDIYIK